jgi:hypothetical protein
MKGNEEKLILFFSVPTELGLTQLEKANNAESAQQSISSIISNLGYLSCLVSVES